MGGGGGGRGRGVCIIFCNYNTIQKRKSYKLACSLGRNSDCYEIISFFTLQVLCIHNNIHLLFSATKESQV